MPQDVNLHPTSNGLTVLRLVSHISCKLCISKRLVYRNIIFLSLHILFLVAILVSCCLYCKQLVLFPLVANDPFTLIAELLNYARKNKHYRNLSALTYWEDQCTSRIDLNNVKFGDSFSEDLVKYVETFVRLLLLIGFVCLYQLSPDLYSLSDYLQNHGSGVYEMCVLDGGGIVRLGAMFVVIALNQLVEFPKLLRHFPGMIIKIGIGLIFLITARSCLLFIDLYGQIVSPK